ncbi:MAG TPA: hypothetical protein VM260_12830, partial [Pirellula sp.]|nr:hypothetical protein [Pirellula sp.]
MQEATAILPESRRWQATFSTYCTNLPPDVECRVRCVIAGSDEARMSIARGTVLDLTKPMGLAPDNDATEAATNGYTVGTTSNLVQSIEELNNASDQTSEDIESALSTHASDDGEYRLKPQIPGRLPIPLAMPSRRFANEMEGWGEKSLNGQYKIWKVLTLALGVLVFLSLACTGLFYFASTKNPFAGIVAETPKETPVPASEEADAAKPNGASSAEPTETSNGVIGATINTPENKPSMDKKASEINENEPIEKELLIATVMVSNAKLPDVTLSAESKYFHYREGNVYLKAKKVGYDYELTPELKGELKIGDTSLPFSISVKNVDEPNLKVVLSDDSEKPLNGYAFVGSKLSAKAEGKDGDAMDNIQTYSWQGDQADDKWVDFSKNQDVQLDSKFARVRCVMRYATSVPADGTEAISKTIAVQPLGIATLDFSKLFFATSENPQNLQIEVSFHSLPKADSSRYRFKYEGVESYFEEGNILKTAIPLDIVIENGQPKCFELPTSRYFEVGANDSKFGANNWLRKACENASEVRERVA